MQTAVEWLVNEMPVIDWSDPYWKIKLDKAKEMEKQQIIDAWSKGYDEDDRASSSPLKYYAETYGSKGSDETKTDKI